MKFIITLLQPLAFFFMKSKLQVIYIEKLIISNFHNNEPMSFKFSTNFLLPYVRKFSKYGGSGTIGLDATPTVQIHICHPVINKIKYYNFS